MSASIEDQILLQIGFLSRHINDLTPRHEKMTDDLQQLNDQRDRHLVALQYLRGDPTGVDDPSARLILHRADRALSEHDTKSGYGLPPIDAGESDLAPLSQEEAIDGR